MKPAVRITLIVLVLCGVYTVLRYHVFKCNEVNGFHMVIRSPAFGIAALSLSALHVAVMGFEGWLTPQDWYGGMPSVSMVSVLIYLLGFFFLLPGLTKQKNNIISNGK